MANVEVWHKDVGDRWNVYVNGALEGTHSVKDNAVRDAKRTAGEGDTVIIRKKNGNIQRKFEGSGKGETLSTDVQDMLGL